MYPTNQETVLMLPFALCGMFAFNRWARVGDCSSRSRPASGIPWTVYGIYAHKHSRPNYFGT